jgi:hypothetical protein
MPDDRLSQLLANGFNCASCGERHLGLFDIAFDHPDPWTGPTEKEPNWAVRHAFDEGRDILSEDFCLMGAHRFVRCILPLKLIGTSESSAFGVWGTLSQTRFGEFVETFDSPDGSSFGTAFSWLSNRLPEASDSPVRAQIRAQNKRQRPILQIEEVGHPIFQLQFDGLTYDNLLAIYAHYGHRLLMN